MHLWHAGHWCVLHILVHACSATHLWVHLVGHVSWKISWARIPDVVPSHHGSSLVTLIKRRVVILLCADLSPGISGRTSIYLLGQAGREILSGFPWVCSVACCPCFVIWSSFQALVGFLQLSWDQKGLQDFVCS